MTAYQFEKEFVLEVGHIDGRQIARPSALVDFMQELATNHAEALGLDKAARERCNAFWVLSRLKYYLNRPLRQHEKLRVVTWPRKIKGALWYRDFRFFAGEEEVGHAVTAWSIISADQHKLVRPKAMQVDVPEQEFGITELLSQIPDHNLQPYFARQVHYSDIDINRHLNNVKAVDILSDAIGLEKHDDWYVSEFQVNYKAETACGTTLQLLRAQEGNEIYIKAMDGEQEKLQAKATIATF
ncbi:MAG: thioesterase [Eubacteriales bacterium]|nr:thioesterase [Eubacteriales bacterium]